MPGTNSKLNLRPGTKPRVSGTKLLTALKSAGHQNVEVVRVLARDQKLGPKNRLPFVKAHGLKARSGSRLKLPGSENAPITQFLLVYSSVKRVVKDLETGECCHNLRALGVLIAEGLGK